MKHEVTGYPTIWLFKLPWLPGDFYGFTLGRLIVIRANALNADTLAHELVHVHRQWLRYGWTFIFMYLENWWRRGRSYEAIEFEIEAERLKSHPFYRNWARKIIALELRDFNTVK